MSDAPEPGRDVCIECGSLLLGDEIPLGRRVRREDLRIAYTNRDGTTIVWECPDCGHMWPRHPEGHRLHGDARALIAAAATEQARQAKGRRP